jgi:hypothetical protein
LYKGDANRGTYRTTEAVLAIPDTQTITDLFARGGATRNYSSFNSPVNGSVLSSVPLGDIWNAPYSGADEDNIPDDCSFWNDKGEADNSTMRGVGMLPISGTLTSVNLYGSGQDPLEPKIGGIKWNMTISIDESNPNSPRVSVSGTHTCYPEHLIKVNGVTVYDVPPLFNNTVYLLGCLLGPQIIDASNPISVPPY